MDFLSRDFERFHALKKQRNVLKNISFSILILALLKRFTKTNVVPNSLDSGSHVHMGLIGTVVDSVTPEELLGKSDPKNWDTMRSSLSALTLE